MVGRRVLFACLVLSVGELGLSGVGAPAQLPAAREGAQGSLVPVLVGYYLNDREESATTRCQLVVLHDAVRVPEARIDGSTNWYEKQTRPPRFLLRCDDHPVVACPGPLLLRGGGTVVLSAYTKLDLLLGDHSTEKFPIAAGSPHGEVWTAYRNGRSSLALEWRALPTALRNRFRGAYALTVESSDGDEIDGCNWYR